MNGDREIFCTTIIPTIGRKTLAKTVNSVLEQKCDVNFEIIVVNDAAQPLEYAEWMSSDKVRILDTQGHERSVARNVGAASARGKYLHFLDDDDLILPGSLNAFWKLSKETESDWLYGFYNCVDNDGHIVEEIQPKESGDCFALFVAGESIPLQTSLLKTDIFFQAGGFDQDPRIIGVEDRELGRRIAKLTSLSYMPQVIAEIRIGEQSSTTNWDTIAESDRLGREKALKSENCFTLLLRSSKSKYIDGRVCRAYLASCLWNIKKRNFLIATNRFLSGSTFALRSFYARDFWAGLIDNISKLIAQRQQAN